MGSKHIWPFNNSAGAKNYTIQTGTLTISAIQTSNTAIITNAPLSKSVLEFTYSSDSIVGEPRINFVNGEITNNTTLTFSRNTSGAIITIRWFVWTGNAATNINVQRGSVDIGSGGALPKNVTISAVVLAKTFPIISFTSGGGSPGTDDVIKATITSTTNLELDMGAVATNARIVKWQIIENPDWSVLNYTVSLTSFTLNQVITSVPLANAYICGSGEYTNTIEGDRVPFMQMTTPTNILFSRTSNSGTWTISLYVVNMSGESVTQHVQNAIPLNVTSDTVTITAVILPKSFIRNGNILNTFQNFDQSNFNADHTAIRMNFNSTTETIVLRNTASPEPVNYALTVHEMI